MIKVIKEKGPVFILETKKTSYIMKVLPSGQIEHLYYGRKIHTEDAAGLSERVSFGPGNTIAYSPEFDQTFLEDLRLEYSSYGKGDIRTPFVEAVSGDGSTTLDFVYEDYSIREGKRELDTMPSSYGDTEDVMSLTLTLKDKNHGHIMHLYYNVFEDCNVITRSSDFVNGSDEDIRLCRMMSMQLDLMEKGYKVTTFTGHWTNEMNKTETLLNAGELSISSVAGVSSNRANPFFMVSGEETNEYHGEAFAFNLVYSGNHYASVSVNGFGKTRIVSGINPALFEYRLKKGEVFEAPEAVMTFAADGYAGISKNMHAFIREHIVRGKYKDKERPVLLNSWEANYFEIDEGKLISLAKKGRDVGVELFVMDDGWFGKRDDDHSSLGDWTVNEKKLPNGLGGLCKKINDLGLDFGIWVEPEMINVDSDLYRAHPDWAISIPDMDHSEGRFQRLLDLSNPEVTDYMIDAMSKVFASANIAYVKWDMNRIFSDYYSKYLPKDRQGELGHRYVLGLYKMMKALTEAFPDILFEGCASGGCRFDLGILSYFPQIWGSDNSDAICRLNIQNGYSYGYPQETYTSHVSACPNHQTLRVEPLHTRYAVALFGNPGYECNLLDMSKDELEEIAGQIALYKKYRKKMFKGQFYRLKEGNIYQWEIASPEKDFAVGLHLVKEVKPADRSGAFKAKGLIEDAKYRLTNMALKHNVKIFGSLINTATSVHVKQDSLVHNVIAKVIRIDGEKEDVTVYGDSLMYAGVQLSQAFVGTGFDDNVRVHTDFTSRLYFIEKI
ncbi:MAG: alpha-galactosidase [Lachnospiraceae bacterium]|nr:alpha-galactosidase [Lachnospiraceae bacterium]